MTDPVDFLLRAAMRLPRPDIARLTEGLIAGLDVIDGDPDLEDSFDQEFVEEREIEDFEGGYPDRLIGWQHRPFATSLPNRNIKWIKVE